MLFVVETRDSAERSRTTFYVEECREVTRARRRAEDGLGWAATEGPTPQVRDRRRTPTRSSSWDVVTRFGAAVNQLPAGKEKPE